MSDPNRVNVAIQKHKQWAELFRETVIRNSYGGTDKKPWTREKARYVVANDGRNDVFQKVAQSK